MIPKQIIDFRSTRTAIEPYREDNHVNLSHDLRTFLSMSQEQAESLVEDLQALLEDWENAIG
jgi:hypothetical protein